MLKRLPQYPDAPFLAANVGDRTCIVLGYDVDEDTVTIIAAAKIIQLDTRGAVHFKKEFKAVDFDVKEAARRYLLMPNVTTAAKAALTSIKEGTFMKKVAKAAAKAAKGKGSVEKLEKAAEKAAAKKDKAAKPESAEKGAGPGRRSRIPEDGKIVMLVKENPFRKGTSRYARFEMAAKSKTVAAYRKHYSNGFLNYGCRKKLLKVVV